MKIFFPVCLAFLFGFHIPVSAQLLNPMCGQGYFFKSGGGQCVTYYGTDGSSGTTQNLPSYAEGLAIGPAFGFTAPNPTYWTVVNGIYYYYNGTSFVSSGHSSGGSMFRNPGGSNDYIYNIDNTGQISRYNGTSNATVITTLTAFSGTNAVQDIVGDSNNNFYLVKQSAPAGLVIFNASGVQTCSYSISGTISQFIGMAIANNRLFLGGSSVYSSGALSGTVINVGYGGVLNCLPTDLASCPSECNLSPAVTASQKTVTCAVPVVTLFSNSETAPGSYTWSGPGIVGSTGGYSIQVNAPGIYTRTFYNCAGLLSTGTIQVKQDTSLPALSLYQSAAVKCSQDPPVILSVNGHQSYTWAPSASLSNSVGSLVFASPGTTTTYTLSSKLNGCTGRTLITVAASAPQVLLPTASQPTVCEGNSTVLNVNGDLSYTWMPGSMKGNTVQVTPQTGTSYTVTGTDSLGCSSSATVKVEVVVLPVFTTLASAAQVCKGDAVTINSSGAESFITEPGTLAGTSVTVAPQASTVYTVTAKNWNCAASKTLALHVRELPLVKVSGSRTEICKGESVVINADGAVSYVWNTNQAGASLVVSPGTNSVFAVTGTGDNGCSATASISLIVSECTGIAENNLSSNVLIYPNPSKGVLTINARESSDGCEISIYNAGGELVMRKTSDTGSAQIDLSGRAAGLYLIRISDRDGKVRSGTVVLD